MKITRQMPPLLTWQISQIIVNYPSPIVIACVLNQSHGHWMLIDVLNFAISFSLKLKKIIHLWLILKV